MMQHLGNLFKHCILGLNKMDFLTIF